jgi:hypothetical protein
MGRVKFEKVEHTLNYRSDFVSRAGMDLLGGVRGGVHPLSPGQGGAGGVLFFMIKQKIIRGKMRYSNLSNNMMISEL